MYLRRGIVIRSFIHSFCPTGYYFLLVSLGITQDYSPMLQERAKQVMYVWHRVCRYEHYWRFAHPCYM